MAAARERAAADSPERTKREARETGGTAMWAPANQTGVFDGLGNRALLALLRSGRLQRKPHVSERDNPLEHEADQVADRLMRGSGPAPITPSGYKALQCECAACAMEQGATIQLKSAPPPPASAEVSDLGQGEPLPSAERRYFEPRLGRDLSDVRIHAETPAAPALGARAFTIGNNIGFAPGEWSPGEHRSRHLLAHELTHIVQQDFGAPRTVQRQAMDAAEIDRRIAEIERQLAEDPSMSSQEVQRLNNERNALVAQRAALPHGGTPQPAAPAAPAPTVIPVDYSYRLVGTVPLTAEATGGAPTSTAATILGGTGAGLGASVPTFVDPLPAQAPIPIDAPNVYTRFLGPESAGQFFDPARLRMQGDFRPRLFQSGGAAQQEAFNIFEQSGIRYAQLS
jgi:hypothetical protein